MNLIKNCIIKIYTFVCYYAYHIITAYDDCFHYKHFIKDLPIFLFSKESGILGNKCYGNYNEIKRALGNDFKKCCMIEHGLYFGRYVIEKECMIPKVNTIYTYSNYRKDSILEHFNYKLDKNIICVGPYIKYARHFLSNSELKNLKAKFGKVLLVFPSHSSPDALSFYNEKEFIAEINDIAKDYDTVIVSLFWLDIKRELDIYYKEKGYVVACSGTRSDWRFLRRQKDLISLADMSMSNDVGTHVGYCISMGVPHYMYRQQINIEYNEDIVGARDDNYNERCRKLEYNEIFMAFNSKEPIIKSVQLEVVKKYWGEF